MTGQLPQRSTAEKSGLGLWVLGFGTMLLLLAAPARAMDLASVDMRPPAQTMHAAPAAAGSPYDPFVMPPLPEVVPEAAPVRLAQGSGASPDLDETRAAAADAPDTGEPADTQQDGSSAPAGSAYDPEVAPPTDPDTAPAGDSASPGGQSNATGDAPIDVPTGDLTEPLKRDLGSQIFFDARTTGLNQQTNQEVLEGDVLAIGAGTLIAADKMFLDRNAGVAEAKGHIVLLNRKLLFLGDAVTYHLDTGDFEITNAVMLSNDTAEIARVTEKIFGFTPRELEFEAARRMRLNEVEAEKERLRREADRQNKVTEPLIDRYALLLERQDLVTDQENPSLGHLAPERRESFKRRRAFWDASQKSVLNVKAGALANAYFHLEGDTLTRVNGNDFTARNALFTPCRCERGDSPAWAFRADEVDAQLGGYADLHHAVLEIKGIPVLYLPHFKVPLKDKRQSGFLMPTFGYQSRSGNTFTQPVYFDLAPNSDATVTTDVYENRGTRLGLEYRVQQHQESGWEFRVEGIRDRLWLEDRGARDELGDMYREGLTAAAAGDSPLPGGDMADRTYTRDYLKTRDYWRSIGVDPADPDKVTAERRQIDAYMGVPENAWRGAYAWRGVTYLAPRLSLVSNGEINSDHRYTEELYVPDDFNQAFFGSREAKAFATAQGQLNLDGKDFYAGLGTHYGDNYLLNERFEGQQLPLAFKVQSRYLSLLPEGFPVPLYGEMLGENVRISEFKLKTPVPGTETLGDGDWRRAKFSAVSPWVTDRIVQVNQFTELEARYIEHSGLDNKRSEIRSWRTGLEFRLPIDGKGELPEALQTHGCDPATTSPVSGPLPADQTPGQAPPPAAGKTADCVESNDKDAPRKFVHHIMDWRLRLSTRPAVVRSGPYTDQEDGYGLAYFASDKGLAPGTTDIDKDVPEEERMKEHQRITLMTDQVWKLFTRGWQRVAGTGTPPAPADKTESSRDRARRELMYSLERPLTDTNQAYSESTQQWLTDRYRLTDAYYETPVSFHADVAYDFLDAKERDEQQERNEQVKTLNATLPADKQVAEEALTEAWKPLNLGLGLSYSGWTLNSAAAYGIYRHAVTSESIYLIFPTFLGTTLSTGYELTKQYQTNNDSYLRQTVRSVSLDTTLIPPVTSFIRVSRQIVDKQQEDYTTTYRTALGFKYGSPSDCWGLQFSREKDFAVMERDASYVLRLSMIFMGQERPLPDMSKGVVRESESERKL